MNRGDKHMIYRNMSSFSRTFHGITVKPGEAKEFPHIVNDPDMMRICPCDANISDKRANSASKVKLDKSKLKGGK